jgi:hypothetical protein
MQQELDIVRVVFARCDDAGIGCSFSGVTAFVSELVIPAH